MSLVSNNASSSSQKEFAIFGGGCFWCLDGVFRLVSGVYDVVSGYAGGHKSDPTYEEVCQGATGHTEVVKIEYDPDQISYEILLEIFWRIHDPTTPNRQGADIGTQYRSAIYSLGDEQKKLAETSRDEAQKLWPAPIVTEIAPLDTFYPAENYHQNYYALNRIFNPYCMSVIDPKVKKFMKEFGHYTKE